MIQLETIQERARTEGINLSLVFKEHLHVLILEYLFKQDAFSHLVFQGGTALRLVYGGVRYSEDLDFVLKEKDSPFLEKLEKVLGGLPSYLEKFVLFAKKIHLKAQRQTPFLRRFTVVIEAEGLATLDKTNLEIVNVPSYENGPAIVRYAGLPGSSPAVRTESLKEILSDKFCAFGSREYVKGRDLWDIYFLKHTLNVPFDEKAKEMTKKKIKDYGSEPPAFLKGFQKNLATLKEKGLEILELEMGRFLPPAYQESFREQYVSVIEKLKKELGGFYADFEKA